MIHGNLLFDKRKDRQLLEGVEEKQEIKLKGGKGQKVQRPLGITAQGDCYLYRRDYSKRITGICVPGTPLHLQTNTYICI